MPIPELRFTILTDSGDARGSSFQTGSQWLEQLDKLADAHIATLLPGHVRGNHYHVERREVIFVLYADEWQLAWDLGEGTQATVQTFIGSGAVIIEVDPYVSHAVANTGKELLWIIGLTNGIWDPQAPDSYPRKVFPPS
jgi:dTDP-4-dehydrorhamnose 3,5-epimerase-like enzyme